MRTQPSLNQTIATEQNLQAKASQRRLDGAGRQLRQVTVVVLMAIAAYFFISHFFLQSVTVVGMSMSPTLADSQRYLLNRWVFYVRAPQPKDVVVIRDPMDNGYSVKRIVATAGDTVYLKAGSLYVNGRKLEEPYLPVGTPTFSSSTTQDQLFKCGPNQFFVLGDNRKNSIDSRIYGPVPRQNILGLIIK